MIKWSQLLTNIPFKNSESIKKYSVERTDHNIIEQFKDYSFDSINPLFIDNYLWIKNKYTPKVEVRLCYSDEYLFLRFHAFEKEITATFTEINDPVHKDSCVEFFVDLFPSDQNFYFNFEINAIGTLFVGFGSVNNRIKLNAEEINKIKIDSLLKEPFEGQIKTNFWGIKLAIPFDLLQEYFQKKFERNLAKANFYKCGDNAKYEHYGCWSRVKSEIPNFHLPEYFGNFIKPKE